MGKRERDGAIRSPRPAPRENGPPSKKRRSQEPPPSEMSDGPGGKAAEPRSGPTGKKLGKRRRAIAKRQREHEARKQRWAERAQLQDEPTDEKKAPKRKAGRREDGAAATAKAGDRPLKKREAAGAAKPRKGTVAAASPAAPDAPAAPRPSALMSRMRAQLSGGRFRHLNEMLYTCTGSAAHARVVQEPALMEEYHAGGGATGGPTSR